MKIFNNDLKRLLITVWKCLMFKLRTMLQLRANASFFLIIIMSSKNVLCEIGREFAEREFELCA